MSSWPPGCRKVTDVARKPKTAIKNDDTPAKAGHNSDAMEISLLKHMAQFRDDRLIIAEAQEALKAVKKRHKISRNAAKQDGWLLKVLDEALDVEENNDRDAVKEADQRRFVFETLALPLGLHNGELFGEPANDAQDEAYWGDRGYNDGLKGLAAKAPAGVSPQFIQAYLRRHAAGADRVAWAQAEAGVNTEHLGTGTGPTAREIGGDDDDDETGDASDDPLLN